MKISHPASPAPGARSRLNRRALLKTSLAAGAALAAEALHTGSTLFSGAEGRGTGAAEAADILIVHGRIATLDPAQPAVAALAIKEGKIVAAGSDAAAMAWRGPATQVIDAEGRTVIPGLNDAHTHFIRTGNTYAYELRWDGVPSLADALRMLRDQARRTPPPMWVQVLGGWSAFQFAEKRMPTLAEINAAAPDTPAYVLHLYDRAFVNAAGLRALGWDRNAPDPFGGVLERDGQGNPTGLIVSKTALLAVVAPTFKFPILAPEERIRSTRHFMREMNRLGMTSLTDAGGGGQAYPENYAGILQLAKDDQLTLRIAYTLFAQRPGKELEDFTQWVGQLRPGEGTDFFRLGGGGEYLVWAAADPANFAWDLQPQAPTAEAQLEAAVRLLAAKGWPFRLHATYDPTAAHILNVLERVRRDIPLNGLRWTIDHGEMLSPRSLERIAALGGAISIQNRMSLDGEAFLRKQGAEAAADAPPIARIRQLGLPLSCGTDGTRATSYNPWIGLHWLVTGKTMGGTRLNAERNLLDRAEALRLFTAAGAWFTREEERKGALAPGRLADLAILSADYFSVPEDDIRQIESVLTMVGGKVVYGAGRYADLAPPPPPPGADWLPIHHYGGYHRAAAGGTLELSTSLAAAATHRPAPLAGHSHAHGPAPQGSEGFGVWPFGCGCGA